MCGSFQLVNENFTSFLVRGFHIVGGQEAQMLF